MARQITIGLATQTPLLPGADQMMSLDADSTLGEVFGHAKQGAASGTRKSVAMSCGYAAITR